MLKTKESITAWCKQMHILEYIIQPDLSLKVYQDVDLSNKNIHFLPVQFKEVIGNFYCKKNHLTSLKGVPFIVGESFNCSWNKINSLEHSPQSVGMNFICASNKISSLEHITPVIKGSLNFSYNPVDTLNHLPEIGGSLLCHACSLTTLKGCHNFIKESLGCSCNKLTNLEGAPIKVGLHLDCTKNPMTSLKGAPEYVGGKFHFGGEKIVDFHLIQTIAGEEIVHYASSQDKRISGFEHLYVYERDWLTLNISAKITNSIRLNKSLTEELLTTINSVKKMKI